jgi:hypothetical protein
VIGLMEMSFGGTAIREPVTTTSCSAGSVAAVLAAVVCAIAIGTVLDAAAAVSTARIANCNLRLFPIVCSLNVVSDQFGTAVWSAQRYCASSNATISDIFQLQHGKRVLPRRLKGLNVQSSLN